MVTLSAVICTHDRPGPLARALESLLEQDERPDEILVIDNAPRNGATRALVLEMARAGHDPSPVYRLEASPGLDHARNHALRAARGEIVAFLDDDAVAQPEWVRETRRAFRRPRRSRGNPDCLDGPDVQICMGRVEALPPLTPGALLFEANGGFGRGSEPVLLPDDAGWKPLIAWSISVGSGCSMAVRKAAVLPLGGFDEALDTAEGLPGGDLDLIWRTLESGGRVLYEPRVRALHQHRSDPEAAIAQIANHNRGLVAMLVKALRGASGSRRLPIFAFLVWRLLKPGFRMARRIVGRDPLPHPALVRIGWEGWQGLGAYGKREQAVRPSAAMEGQHG